MNDNTPPPPPPFGFGFMFIIGSFVLFAAAGPIIRAIYSFFDLFSG